MSADVQAGAFRRDYHASLLVATMKGTADMVTTAGLPFHKKNALTPLAFSNVDPTIDPSSSEEANDSDFALSPSQGEIVPHVTIFNHPIVVFLLV